MVFFSQINICVTLGDYLNFLVPASSAKKIEIVIAPNLKGLLQGLEQSWHTIIIELKNGGYLVPLLLFLLIL